MPKAGDRFEMVDGSVYEVLKTAADTGGEFVEMIFHLPPGCVAPPPPPPPSDGGEKEKLKKRDIPIPEPGTPISDEDCCRFILRLPDGEEVFAGYRPSAYEDEPGFVLKDGSILPLRNLFAGSQVREATRRELVLDQVFDVGRGAWIRLTKPLWVAPLRGRLPGCLRRGLRPVTFCQLPLSRCHIHDREDRIFTPANAPSLRQDRRALGDRRRA